MTLAIFSVTTNSDTNLRHTVLRDHDDDYAAVAAAAANEAVITRFP